MPVVKDSKRSFQVMLEVRYPPRSFQSPNHHKRSDKPRRYNILFRILLVIEGLLSHDQTVLMLWRREKEPILFLGCCLIWTATWIDSTGEEDFAVVS
jgi:hypothetical protein